LEDVLGGNCITICIVNLSPNVETSRITLQYSQLLRAIRNFPIINDDRTNGLLRKYKIRLQHLKQEYELAELNVASRVSRSTVELERQLAALQDKLGVADADRTTQLEEKRKLYSMYMEFRNKFGVLVETKTKLQADLIKSEEERLAVSKLLIDMQIERTDDKDALAQEKYKFETRLLHLESEAAEWAAREQKFMQEKQAFQKQLESLLQDKKEMDLEYVALKQNFINVGDDLRVEKARNEKIGVEMLNLVNAKTALEAQTSRLQQELARLQSSSSEMQSTSKVVTEERGILLQQVTELKSHNEKMNLELIRKDIEMKNLSAEFESRKTGVERNYVDFTRDKDSELLGARQALERENKTRIEAVREADAYRTRAEAEIRQLKRSKSDQDQVLGELQEANANMTNELEVTRAKITKLSEQYRTKLLQYMNEVTDLSSTYQVSQDGGAAAAGGEADFQPALEKMQKDLVKTHRERENELMEEVEAERRNRAATLRKLRALIVQYKNTRDKLLDLEPHQQLLLSDQDLKAIGDESLQVEKFRDDLTSSLQRQLGDAREEIALLKESVVREADAHSKALAVAQRKLVVSQDELAALTRVHQQCDPANKGKEQEKALNDLKDLQNELKDQLMRMASAPARAGGTPVGPRVDPVEMGQLKDTIERLRKETGTLRDENKRLRDEVAAISADAASGAGGGGKGSKQLALYKREREDAVATAEGLRVRLADAQAEIDRLRYVYAM
jgi:hypothetical protein